MSRARVLLSNRGPATGAAAAAIAIAAGSVGNQGGKRRRVIKLSRLNGKEFILNAHLIKFVEKTPDTLITLRDGEKVMVREEPEEVVRRAVEYLRRLRVLPDRND
jgi:flagellar protein FlbD